MNITNLSIGDAIKSVGSDSSGLSADEARRRLERDGPNRLRKTSRAPLIRRFATQFTHFLAVLLWVAAVLSFAADALNPGQGMATLGWAIVGVIVINAVFSFVQEYKAERAIAALQRLLPPSVWVMRGGQPMEVPGEAIVRGDILLLEEGQQIPADGRVIESAALRVDNSTLSGESRARRRMAEPSSIDNPLEAPNLVLAGTTVVSGRGRAVVHATGMATQFGRIADLAAAVEPAPSPLQQEIGKATRWIAALSVGMGLIFFLVGMATGVGLWVSAIFGIGIIVANVPEGLLPTVTLALAMASQRMARRGTLIKQLSAVEALGCTTVICTDKTGTLTENRMRVERVYVNGLDLEARGGQLLQSGRLYAMYERDWLTPFIEAMALCNNAKRLRTRTGEPTFVGDPTEVAMLEFACRRGLSEREYFARMRELPFDADRKRMTTLHWIHGKLVAFVKGAPEVMLPLCTRVQGAGRSTAMSEETRKAILARADAYAGRAYRVLAVAMRRIERGARTLTEETVERELTFLGLVALFDPPRPQVPEAIARCRQAGIRTIMITGDHPLTALAVGRQIGLVSPETDPQAVLVEGTDLDGWTDERLQERLRDGARSGLDPIFARMTAQQKLRVVGALKAVGEVVAVTGDGVNDAPAIKRADIGIAMGIAGTDVAKATADMILLDDNFATIVNAVEEGRAVYGNIRKFVTYVLASNVPEIVPYVGYGALHIPLALTIPQILAVDLGTDLLPALALGAERADPGIMSRPPRPRSERLLNWRVLLRAYGFLGAIEAAVAMTAFFGFLFSQGWDWGQSLPWDTPLSRQATSVTLAAIVLAQVANVFACRSEQASIVAIGVTTNRLLLIGIVVELLLLLALVYTPLGQLIFGTASLPLWLWPLLVLGGLLVLVAEEMRKWVLRRRKTS